MKRNPHAILSVEKSASTAEIKSAYRKLAKECHPDRKDGAALFVEATEAYELFDLLQGFRAIDYLRDCPP